jgi:hypothetical protein
LWAFKDSQKRKGNYIPNPMNQVTVVMERHFLNKDFIFKYYLDELVLQKINEGPCSSVLQNIFEKYETLVEVLETVKERVGSMKFTVQLSV